jgi:hypothetical protein
MALAENEKTPRSPRGDGALFAIGDLARWPSSSHLADDVGVDRFIAANVRDELVLQR